MRNRSTAGREHHSLGRLVITLSVLASFALTACSKAEPLPRQQAPVAASRGNQSDLAEVVMILFLLGCNRAREDTAACAAIEQVQQLKKKSAQDFARTRADNLGELSSHSPVGHERHDPVGK